ncbi:hypothetical protein ES702_06229 [subsurface metagenome]
MKNSRKQALLILATLHHVNAKHGNLYCYPAQLTIMNLLAVYHDTKIAIATLNRWLRDLEDKGYILRTRRIKKDKRLGIMFKSTLYKITILGYHTLGRAGVSVWREIKAITAAGLKAADRALSKFTGPVSMRTIVAATGMFGRNGKTVILEK